MLIRSLFFLSYGTARARQLGHSDFNTEVWLIHLTNLQKTVFSVGLTFFCGFQNQSASSTEKVVQEQETTALKNLGRKLKLKKLKEES